MTDREYLKVSAERLLNFDPKQCESRDRHQKMKTLYNMAFREQATPSAVLELLAEIERLKKFEEWFARIEVATTAIDASFRAERDIALSECEALRPDAIRYRYMRDFPYNNIARAVGVTAGNGQWLQFDEADQVIDKAMADDEALRQELAQ